MKHITATIALSLFFITAGAQGPEGYEDKTAKLADNFVKCSKEGNYNKTYKALRKIQKYEFRLDKDQLVTFYSDLHEAVCDACDRYGAKDYIVYEENGKSGFAFAGAAGTDLHILDPGAP